MHFSSDNWAGAHPAIANALQTNSDNHVASYGDSELDARVRTKFNDVFERDVEIFYASTGTAANALALSSLEVPGGIVFCHREAHVMVDECGAPEFFSPGSRLAPVDGIEGKMNIELLEQRIAAFAIDDVHIGQPKAITLTQASEVGTVYTPSEIEQIADLAKSHRIALHMDGARFANALIALNMSPAEMTWKLGVDIVSFGGTKNGCWCAEAIVFTNRDLARQMAYIQKRSGQLFSKSRFISAQFDAYLTDDLWLHAARHANTMASKLAEMIENSGSARLGWQHDTNELFVIASRQDSDRWQRAGVVFSEWPTPGAADGLIGEGECLLRFVTNFATSDEEIEKFGKIIA